MEATALKRTHWLDTWDEARTATFTSAEAGALKARRVKAKSAQPTWRAAWN
jgi:hypothetical protein